MGIPSITSNDVPLPKLRVTRPRCTPARPQEAHTPLDEIDRDDVENAREADLDDRFGPAVIKRAASNDDFGFMRLTVFQWTIVALGHSTGAPSECLTGYRPLRVCADRDT